MYFTPSKPNFIIILMALALLNACTSETYNAPVKADNKEFAEDRYNPVSNELGLNKDNPIVSRNMKKYHVVKNWRTLHSAGLITVGKKTIKSIPDKTQHEDKNTHLKQQTKLDVAKKPTSQQQSIVLIDNKKMLVLNFGWPIKGKVIKSFSPSRNKGIDIAGKKGQSVNATEAGQVVYGGQGLIGFGKLLIIKHNNVYLSAYANTSRLLVKEGQHVVKGQVIAEVGDLGIKRTSLHFEIRKNGKPVNPLKLLPKK